MHTVKTATHLAHLDPMTGEGVLVLPSPDSDVPNPFASLGACSTSASAHAADWAHMLNLLAAHGWEPSEDEDAGWVEVGTTRDGRQVIGLYGRAPIISNPTMDEMARASVALLKLAQDAT